MVKLKKIKSKAVNDSGADVTDTRDSAPSDATTPDIDDSGTFAAESPAHADDANAPQERLITGNSSENSGSDAADMDEYWGEYTAEAPLLTRVAHAFFPILITATAIGWTAFFIWSHWPDISQLQTPKIWGEWLLSWSTPVLLLVLIGLVHEHKSGGRLNTLGQSAADLETITAQLEDRIGNVNRELSIAREFLHSQVLELESFGRQAVDRLSGHAHQLQTLVHDNSAQIMSIGAVSEKALGNMQSLRDNMPIISNLAKDVTSHVGNAGNTAEESVRSLLTQVETIRDLGKQGKVLAAEFEAKIAEALGRFGSLNTQQSAFVSDLEAHENATIDRWHERIEEMKSVLANTMVELNRLDQDALTATQKKLAELDEEAKSFEANLRARGDALHVQMVQRHQELDTIESSAQEKFLALIAQYESALKNHEQEHDRFTVRMYTDATRMSENIATIRQDIQNLIADSEASQGQMSQHTMALLTRLTESNDRIAAADGAMTGLTDKSVRLLEIIQGSAVNLREALPKAINDAEGRLSAIETRAADFVGVFTQTGEKSETIASTLENLHAANQNAIAQLDTLFERMHATYNAHQEKMDLLQRGMEALDRHSETIKDRSSATLTEALAALSEIAEKTPTQIEESFGKNLVQLTEKISGDASTAIDQAITEQVVRALQDLESASARAQEVGAETATHLTQNLEKLEAVTAQLETRVAEASEDADRHAVNDFAKRVGQITDTLNSNAIDIGEALASEVSEADWHAYLKGDRGIFTRKVVKILSNSQAKDIAAIYHNDDDFRANASRYIHEFESMLRSVLASPNGNTISVTLLSSDVGKLYVALAQAIERIRK